MRTRSVAAIVTVAALGCYDEGPKHANPADFRVISGYGQSGPVGTPLPIPLVVRVVDADTLAIPDLRVNFRVDAGSASLSTDRAITDSIGAVSVIVTPLAPGSILVTASLMYSSFSATFLLAGTGTTTTCSAATVSLVPTEIAAGLGGASACVGGGSLAGGATYALIAFNADETAGASTSITVTGTGVGPGPAQSGADQRADAPRPMPVSYGFLMSAAAPAPATAGTTSALVTVGQLLSLNANVADSCANPQPTTGRVVAVTPSAIVVADTMNPAGGFSDADLQSIATTFDTLIVPVDTLNFRAAADIDDNRRTVLLFTRAVNAIVPTPLNHSLVVFKPRDLDAAPACVGSNAGEILYLAVPDSTGVLGTPRTKTQVLAGIHRATVHSYQHLINASRRRFRMGGPPEEPWLDEALSLISEELLFQRTAAHGSRQNLNSYDMTVTLQSRDAYRAFQRPNQDNFVAFLQSTAASSPFLPSAAVASRGAAWSLLRYLVDRRAWFDYNSWTELVNTRETGMNNLRRVFGASLPTQMRDWSIALLTDDLFGASPQFTMPSWNFRSLFAALDVTPYPLAVLPLNGPATVSVASGSAAYFTFTVASGTVGSVAWRGPGTSVPPLMQWSLVRLK